MKLLITQSDGKVTPFENRAEPFIDILGFHYSGETGCVTVNYTAEGMHGQPQTTILCSVTRIEFGGSR